MSATHRPESHNAINDSDLIRMRYRGCVAKQKPVPAPMIWQRRPKQFSQNHADSAINSDHKPSLLVAEEQSEEFTVQSSDEWSKQFLYLIDESEDFNHSAKDLNAYCPPPIEIVVPSNLKNESTFA